MTTRQLCTFGVDELRFGIDVDEVEEVSRRYTLTRVPLAPVSVAGLVNLRGRIVTAIDLRDRLGLPQRVVDEPFHIVAVTSDSRVSLLVDFIGDVVQVSDEDFEPPPETTRQATRELIRGLYKLDRLLLLVLDLQRVASVDNKVRLRSGR